MNKRLFAMAFAIGLLSVAWVGAGFVGTNWLALAMTAVIAAVFVAGALELRQFRAGTAALQAALAGIPQPLPTLGEWLEGVPSSLRSAVRQRVEGERGALPGPALTPYLVGLLVMLGMLGTFLGMVVTFKGAVFALERSTDLQAMRSALAAPIRGLGLSFGTSVAGVAASAMLGLMSAVSRRERLDVARLLDSRVAAELRPFSLVHQRQETFRALQSQANALPEVAGQLDSLMARIEQRSRQLDEQLMERQAQFHREVKLAYTELAQSVGSSLQESLAASARAAGDTIAPVVESAMAQIVHESQRMQQRVGEAAQAQVDALSRQFTAAAASVSDSWTSALQVHARTSEDVAGMLQRSLGEFTQGFEQRSAALVASVDDALVRSRSAHEGAERERLAAWTEALHAMAADLQSHWQRAGEAALEQQQAVARALEQTAADIAARTGEQAARAIGDAARLLERSEELVRSRAESEERWVAQHGERMDQLAALWRSELSALRGEEAERGQAATERMEQLAALWRSELSALRSEEAERGRIAAERSGQLASAWLTQLEDLREQEAGRARAAAEQAREAAQLWRSELSALRREEAEHAQAARGHMDEAQTLWRAGLAALRDEEAARGEAAVARLGELESAVAQHLATLGAALEAPLARLLQTASEVPQAAAGVIAQLREEMSRMGERDNLALQERTALLEQLASLLQAVNQASGEQREAVEGLVASASAVLEQAGSRFAQVLDAQSARAADMAVQVQAGAVEVASLADAFTQGVQQFQAGNDRLVEVLQRVEAAMGRSSARSDEQLAYYVAQAREVIDLSIASQADLVESLRELQLQARQARPLALAEGSEA